MATAQMQRPKEALNTWSELLPNPTLSKNQSEMFVKKLVALAVSNVTYLRAMFPEDAYVQRQLEGIRLKILRDDGSCPSAGKLILWLKGAFEALSKNFLRQLTLAVHAEGADPDEALETYTFCFTYKDENMSALSMQREDNRNSDNRSTEMNCSLKEIRQTTLEMLRTTIQLTHSLPMLPEKFCVSMKLLYYDEGNSILRHEIGKWLLQNRGDDYKNERITPGDYEPPGFYTVESSSYNFTLESINLRLGEIMTPFHGIKFRSKVENSLFGKRQKYDATNMQNVQNDAASILSSDRRVRTVRETKLNESTMSEDIIDSSQSDAKHIQQSRMVQPEEAMSVPPVSPAQPETGDKFQSCTEALKTPTEVREAGVRCACGIEKDGGLMVNCIYCNKWQHGACYGLMNQDDLPQVHVCEQCHKPESEIQKCTDIKLLGLTKQQRQEICLYRRALSCIEESRITPKFLSEELDVSDEIAKLLFELLDRDGVLRRSKGLPRIVNMKVLKKEVLPRYFGPSANLKSHQYSFKFDNLEDSNTESMKNMSIASSRTSMRNRKKRMEFVIDDEDDYNDQRTSKRQKTSRGDDRL